MVTSRSGVIKQIKKKIPATEDEFGLFLCPFADNQYYPTNPSGPNPCLGIKIRTSWTGKRILFNFRQQQKVCRRFLDNSPVFTNLMYWTKIWNSTGCRKKRNLWQVWTEEQMKTLRYRQEQNTPMISGISLSGLAGILLWERLRMRDEILKNMD